MIVFIAVRVVWRYAKNSPWKRSATSGEKAVQKATRICDVTLVTLPFPNFLIRFAVRRTMRLTSSSAIRGSDFAVEFLIFRFPLTAKRKPT
jgi:hypothetical protein